MEYINMNNIHSDDLYDYKEKLEKLEEMEYEIKLIEQDLYRERQAYEEIRKMLEDID